MMRDRRSVPPPGGNGATKRIRLVGYACAFTRAHPADNPIATPSAPSACLADAAIAPPSIDCTSLIRFERCRADRIAVAAPVALDQGSELLRRAHHRLGAGVFQGRVG